MEKVKRAYYLPEDVLEMLERMSTDEFRTLSGELELAIRERYEGKYGTDTRGVYGLSPRAVVEPAQEVE